MRYKLQLFKGKTKKLKHKVIFLKYKIQHSMSKPLQGSNKKSLEVEGLDILAKTTGQLEKYSLVIDL